MRQRFGQPQKIDGPFQATVVLSPPNKRLFDIDNRVKVMLDFAQKVQIIENDSLCKKLLVECGDIDATNPSALLIIEPWYPRSVG